MRILTVNAGSSSLKLSLLGPEDELLLSREGDLDELLGDPRLRAADVVAHRIVHGGDRFRAAVMVDAQTRRQLNELASLTPLHGTQAPQALDHVSAALPDKTTLACFDTAFHATLPPASATYALPAVWRERWALRRYGFHGLSHAWVARRVPEVLGRPVRRLVSCHLGAGASLCAVRDGCSVDTTMGFTPLEGLVMATRCGNVDPGLLLWLLEQTGMSERELGHALEHESGLLALSGSADMRDVLAQGGLALDVYVHRLCAGIAAMAATLRGIDALAFTGGVGEHAARIRELAADGLAFLGIAIACGNADGPADVTATAAAASDNAPSPAVGRDGPDGDVDVTAPGAAVSTVVIHAREDLEMARQVRATLAA